MPNTQKRGEQEDPMNKEYKNKKIKNNKAIAICNYYKFFSTESWVFLYKP